MSGDASLKTGVIIGAVVLLFGFGIFMLRPNGEVEHIGQPPEELGNVTTPTAKPEEPKATNNATTTESASTAAATQVGLAQNAAAAALTATTNANVAQTTGAVSTTPKDDGARPPADGKSENSGSKPPPKPVATPSSGTDCPGGMRLVKSKKLGNYCIDSYEFPGSGVKPKTGVSWFQAKKYCEKKDKRLCALKEWRSACGSKYPYGTAHDPEKCNTADEDGFERSLSATGSFKMCRSRSGAYDMVGNAHEWVSEQRIAGGGFESDEEVGSCRYSSPKSPGSSAGYIGFRCCATPN